MESLTAIEILTTLGHDGRLSVFRLLVRRMPDRVPAGEIARVLGLKANTASVYLSALERAGLVRARRAGRQVCYDARPDRVSALVDFLVADCCRSRPDLCGAGTAPDRDPDHDMEPAMTQPVYNVLFICSGNSARSIFAEALLRDLGAGGFKAYSAGTNPSSGLNPFAVELLERNGHEIGDLCAKSTAQYQVADAPRMDFVFTVCDTAANEDCPPWPGQPISGHWGLPDPVKVIGAESEKALAFAQTYGAMRRRVQAFVALPIAQLDRIALQSRVDEISQLDEA